MFAYSISILYKFGKEKLEVYVKLQFLWTLFFSFLLHYADLTKFDRKITLFEEICDAEFIFQ